MPPWTTEGKRDGPCGHSHLFRFTAEMCRDSFFRRQWRAGLLTDRRIRDLQTKTRSTTIENNRH
jgi:hypothetical protein